MRGSCTILAGLWTTLAACAPRSTASFDAPDPNARLKAIVAAAEEGDRRAIPRLIEQLDADDPAIRLFSIRALERLTGETHGFDHAGPYWERREAIGRWREWYRSEAEGAS